jgi:predicted secreted protein
LLHKPQIGDLSDLKTWFMWNEYFCVSPLHFRIIIGTHKGAGGCRVGAPTKQNLKKKTYFVDTMTSKVSLNLGFRLNQPLKSVDN